MPAALSALVRVGALGVLGIGALGAGAALASPAGAQGQGSDVTSVVAAPELIDEVADAVVAQGTFVEEGAGVDPEDLAAVQARIRDAGQGWAIVALSTPPPRGTRNFVANLLAEVRPRDRSIDTVLVVTRDDVAGSSRAWDDAALDAALAAAIPVLDHDPAGGWSVVYEQLVGGPLPPAPSDGGGVDALVPWLAAAAVVITLVSIAAAALQLRERHRERSFRHL